MPASSTLFFFSDLSFFLCLCFFFFSALLLLPADGDAPARSLGGAFARADGDAAFEERSDGNALATGGMVCLLFRTTRFVACAKDLDVFTCGQSPETQGTVSWLPDW